MVELNSGPRGRRACRAVALAKAGSHPLAPTNSDQRVLAPIGDKGCLGNHDMINPLECDIAALYAPEMQWFSHDLERSPAPIVWKDGRAEIGLTNGERLALTQDDVTVRTERTSIGK